MLSANDRVLQLHGPDEHGCEAHGLPYDHGCARACLQHGHAHANVGVHVHGRGCVSARARGLQFRAGVRGRARGCARENGDARVRAFLSSLSLLSSDMRVLNEVRTLFSLYGFAYRFVKSFCVHAPKYT